MKRKIGYVIYQFWDIKTKNGDDGELEVSTSAPHPEFKKRIYIDPLSAEDAVKQMKRVDFSNTSYHILPIYTDEEEYVGVVDAYRQRLEENENKNKRN